MRVLPGGGGHSSGIASPSPQPAHAAEFGTGPWVKGYTDIFGGILPPVPGFYFRTDAYHYNGSADRIIFNGFAQLGVEEDYTATIAALTYVTPWKILGGTYAVAVVPSMVAMDVDVGIDIPQFTGPLGQRTFGPFNFRTGDTNLALGDTAFAPLVLGWNAGNFHWNVGVFGFAPTGDYSKKQLANTSLNHWAVMNRIAGTYYNPKTGWQVNGAAIYSVNWENPATDYETGNILNLDGAIVKNFGRWGVGVGRLRHDPDHRRQRLGRQARLVRVPGLRRRSDAELHDGRSRAIRSPSSPSTIKSSTPRTRSRATPSTSPSPPSFETAIPLIS